ncbi:MAG: arabinose-5-phosphate isomerase [Candidatus Deianiraeaceae bacterium]|jgi:arabinose-5-phosphate isomerase
MQKLAREILETQKAGVEALAHIIDSNLEKVIDLIAQCKGHVVFFGIGKSGNIAVKIASSMSSLGIPAFFVDPSNAGHGDIGMLTKHDIAIVISKSGESADIMSVLNYCFENKIQTVAITRNTKSAIAQNANYSLVIPQSKESHPFNAPTTSTTQTLVLGDILTACASYTKNFTKEQYAKLHPSGNLGMKIAKVKTIINHQFCAVDRNTNALEVLQKMTEHSNGFVCVLNEDKTLHGIITDGDVRRYILQHREICNVNAVIFCNKNPKSAKENDYIIDVVNIITQYRIGCVIIVDEDNLPVGFVARNQFNI